MGVTMPAKLAMSLAMKMGSLRMFTMSGRLRSCS